MKSAIYCRVSTEDQEKEGTSLDSQLEACILKAKELEYEVSDDLILKETFSGLAIERPQLDILRNRAREGEFKAVIIYSPDRLSRVGEDILSLAKDFKIYGVKLLFVKEQWDDTLQGKMVAFILGWASEFEAAQIKERTMRGKHTLVNKGILPQGTGVGLYGYRWDKNKKKRVPIDFEVRVVEKVFTMIAEGSSRYKTAQTLNELGIPTKSRGKWHPLTIERMITSQTYIGITYFGRRRRQGKKEKFLPEEKWLKLPDTTPAVISKELFERANNKLQKSKELHYGRPQNEYLLTGYIKCGYCGHPLIGSCLNHRYRYYHCRGTYPTTTRGAVCNARYINAGQLEDVVWSKVREVIEHPKVVLAELQRRAKSNGSNKTKREITKLGRRLEGYENQEKRLIKLGRFGELNEESILSELSQLKEDKERDQIRLNQLLKVENQYINTQKVKSQLNDFCQRVKSNLNGLSLQDKRYALDALDIKVIVWNDRAEIKASVPLEYINIKRVSRQKLVRAKRNNNKGNNSQLVGALS